MDPALVEDIKGDFIKVDKNKDGMVELAEFAYHCAKFSEATFEQLEALFKKLDTNGDGKISWEEYLDFMYKRILSYREKSTLELFKRLDVDGDGQVTDNEVKARSFEAFGYHMTDDEVKDFFKKVDANSDGKISFEEFKKFMEQ